MAQNATSGSQPAYRFWKEIAAFRRDERTVKRWEKERGCQCSGCRVIAQRIAYADELSRCCIQQSAAAGRNVSEQRRARNRGAPVAAETIQKSNWAAGRRSVGRDRVLAVAALALWAGVASIAITSQRRSSRPAGDGAYPDPVAREFYLKGATS